MNDQICEFCGVSAIHVIDGFILCDSCIKTWLDPMLGSEMQHEIEQMARDRQGERMERNMQDPGYIYDLTHYPSPD